MRKSFIRLTLGAFVVILMISLVQAAPVATSADSFPTATLPTPTFLPSKPFDYPGVNLLLPSAGTFSAEMIRGLGYEISASESTRESGTQRVGIWIAGPRYERRYEPSNAMRITASVLLSSSDIFETYIGLEKVFLDLSLTVLEWALIDPKPIFMTYGTPSVVRASLGTNKIGFVGSITAIWENHNVSVMYTIILKAEDEIEDRALDPRGYPVRFKMCLLPERIIGFNAWLASEERDILEAMRYPYDYDHAFIFGQPFSPTMFTNAPDLATLAQRLANGECLETRREVWFGSQ